MGIDDLGYPEVTLRRNGLKLVICQLRYDPLLRIAHEPPLQFQEMLRPSYPKIENREPVAKFEIQLGEAAEGATPRLMQQSAGLAKWLFKSEDENWTVSLDINSLGLETTAYEHFPDFAERFRVLFDGFRDSYPGINDFKRVGLRYVNIFTRDEFPDGAWLARFNSTLMGPMADHRIGGGIVSALQQFAIAESDWTINVRHGTEEDGYRLDMDHATQAVVRDDEVIGRLDAFNKRLYQIFRWAISEEFFNEMEPSDRR